MGSVLVGMCIILVSCITFTFLGYAGFVFFVSVNLRFSFFVVLLVLPTAHLSYLSWA